MFAVKPDNTVEISPVTVGRAFGDKVVIEKRRRARRYGGDRRPAWSSSPAPPLSWWIASKVGAGAL